ncbi:hypothetical protein PMIN06_007598 [Paraphaeosphaeria minitans]
MPGNEPNSTNAAVLNTTCGVILAGNVYHNNDIKLWRLCRLVKDPHLSGLDRTSTKIHFFTSSASSNLSALEKISISFRSRLPDQEEPIVLSERPEHVDICIVVGPGCPIEATPYGYYPSLPWNAFFAGLFGLYCLSHLVVGIL